MSGSNRLYVSPSGSDSYDGKDPSTPFRTIKAAVESLGEAVYTNTNKKYTIFVGSGEYTEQNPIALPPGVAIVGDTLRTVRLTAANPIKDYFHCHDGNYFYGLRFLNLRNPSFSFSYPCSTATGSISAGGVSSIGVVHSMTGYTDGNNQDLGIIIEGPDASGSIATATANVVGGVITQINVVSGGTNYSATEKPHISIPAPLSQRPIIGTSPYIQNCSSITGPFTTDGVLLSLIPGNANYAELPYNINDVRNQSGSVIGSGLIDEQGAGGGIRIDGNLVHPLSPLESFVADAFTQVNQGGPGHLVINKGYAQFVSCFTTFCTYGFKTANGGFANISNSVIDFGAKGLVSKTYFPQTYNTGSSLEEQTSQVSGIRFSDKGAGYTGSTVPVLFNDGGYSVRATGYATINNDTSLADIVITNSGSGYTSRPTVQIDAPTAIGNRAAIVVDGSKADISGVTQMLMALESGSRGIDISSNMILNGVNYLVTDVLEVTGSANQRRVTTYPAPPSISITDTQIKFHQLSNISTGGLVMEYVGSGVTYNALPKFGGVPIRTREINQIAPGRVFYSTVDNIGNLKIGEYFAVNQLTGEVTINANSFNLSGLNAIGPFRRNGAAVGVVLQEVSNNTTLVNAQGLFGEDTVPTQYAVKGYIDIRDGRLNNLETTSASLNVSISSLNTYTASLKTAIDVTGGNTRILGNLIVDGTQTSLNTTETFIEDKSITLASGSTTSGIADGAGLNIAGANVSMSWEDSNQRLYFNTNIAASGSISSSTIIGLNNVSVTTYSTSVDSRLSNLQLNSGSLNNSVSLLNTFSSSVLTQLSTLETYTSSIDSKISSINSFTNSANTRLGKLEESTASLNSFTASVYNTNAFTNSANTRLGKLEESTASLNLFSESVNGRFTTLQTYTGSINNDLTSIHQTTASLNSFSSSTSQSLWQLYSASYDLDSRVDYIEGVAFGGIDLNAQFAALLIVTSSIQQFTSSAKISLARLELQTASFDSAITNIQAWTASAKTSLVSLEFATSSIQSFTASAKISLANLELQTASFDTSITNINSTTASLNTSVTNINLVTASLNTSITNINSTTASLNSTTASLNSTTESLNISTASLNTFTASMSTTSSVRFGSLGVGMEASGVSGEINTSGDIIAYSTSDIRLKENIEPIINALTKVETISGNTYDWKEGFEELHSHKGNDVGVIAQEIQKILPEAVIERDNGYLGVNYEKIIPLLIESIKELSAKVKELENK
jgi:septal ring factor EnvC (AmiA/AmiB activator)